MSTKHIIKKTKIHHSQQLSSLIQSKAHGHQYASLPRNKQRQAEYHKDRVTDAQNLQKDLRRAERMAQRIAQVIEQLMKDVTKMKQHAGRYTFVNTVGTDSTASGQCESDLSTSIDTRHAWKEELKQFITMATHYVEAQSLGNYLIGHRTPETDTGDDSCATTFTASECCPRVYRSIFHYATPAGDCMRLASSMNGHSGASGSVLPTGDTVEDESPSPDAENKDTPNAFHHNGVTNCDFKIRQLMELVVDNNSDPWGDWILQEIAIAVDQAEYIAAEALDGGLTNTNRIDHIRDHLTNVSCLPTTMVFKIHEFIYDDVSVTDPHFTESTSIDVTVYVHTPHIGNIEDESDMRFLFKMLTDKLNLLRSCQHTNDREQQRITYVRGVSECNHAFHQDALDELVQIDPIEVDAKIKVGKELCQELNSLYKEHAVSKQTFFGGGVLNMCCW